MIIALRIAASVMLTAPIFGMGIIARINGEFDKEAARILSMFGAVAAIPLCAIWIR